MLDRLLDHKADEHFFEEVHAPIFYLGIELLRRNIEKVSQLLGVVEPEKVRKSSRHEHLERDEIPLAKLVMKEGEKPGKFLLPHGMILLLGVFAFSWRIIPKVFRIKAPLALRNYQFISQITALCNYVPPLLWLRCRNNPKRGGTDRHAMHETA